MKLKYGEKNLKIEFRIGQVVVARIREHLGYGLEYYPTKQSIRYSCYLLLPFEEQPIECNDVPDAKVRLKQYLGEGGFAHIQEFVVFTENTVEDKEIPETTYET